MYDRNIFVICNEKMMTFDRVKENLTQKRNSMECNGWNVRKSVAKKFLG